MLSANFKRKEQLRHRAVSLRQHGLFFWQYKVYADIRGSSLQGQGALGCRQQLFSVLSLARSSKILEIRPALLYSDTESLISFPLIPKHLTLNEPEWLFHPKFCLRACRSKTSFLGFQTQLRKTDKRQTHTISGKRIS